MADNERAIRNKMVESENTVSMQEAFRAVVNDAYRASADLGREVDEILRLGREQPLEPAEAVRLLTRVLAAIQNGARQRGDHEALEALEVDIEALVERLVLARERDDVVHPPPAPRQRAALALQDRPPAKVGPVYPTPVFHQRRVPMNCGFVRTADIDLWAGNLRLEIHRAQFRHTHGREPTSPELLDIMLSKMPLPGLSKDDEFKILELASSIAVNGVQKPPVLDTDGTLMDGNRRVTACHYILNSDEFTSEEKQRAEWLFVWQLTEHATEEDRTAVVVALNFEPDYKEQWPPYVKAKTLYSEWQGMLALEPTTPGPKRQAAMKRDLSKRYALGPESSVVNRFLKMVEWATEFEDYHVGERGRDPFEVMHRANKYWEYFDELSKGAQKPTGVASVLGRDDALRNMVFDLLYQGKFKNWNQIRELKHIHANDESRDMLRQAAAVVPATDNDLDYAQELVERAVTTAKIRSADQREVGANTRIETFVTWLEELPVRAFRDSINDENLRRLVEALRLVERQAAAAGRDLDSDS